MPRYVVLHHQFPAGHARAEHWDLMLQFGDVLRTWALPSAPLSGSCQNGEPLADHRLAYLDYEGPISGDRGWVTRWDAGDYELISADDGLLEVTLAGKRFSGTLRLERQCDDHFWIVSLGAAPTTG